MKRFPLYSRHILSIVLVLLIIPLTAQKRSDLEKERDRIIQEIELANQKVENAEESTQATLRELASVNKEIESRKALIDNLKSQINVSLQSLEQNQTSKEQYSTQLQVMDSSYQHVMRLAYIKSMASNPLLSLFSARSLNEALLIWRYSHQFEAYVTEKRKQVEHLQHVIAMQNSSLLEEQEYNHKLLEQEKSNFEKLASVQARKDSILKELKSKEQELRNYRDAKKKERENLNSKIEKIILKELNERARNRKTATAAASFSTKNSLDWPVLEGYIETPFGDQKHPTLSNLTITNNGIDIASKANAAVNTVADGVVIGITKIPGFDTMVIVEHGSHYTVYSKLSQTTISKDQKVLRGQVIGNLGNSGKLHFEIWKGKQKLNPQSWLKRK